MYTAGIHKVSGSLLLLDIERQDGETTGSGYLVNPAGRFALTCGHLVRNARAVEARGVQGRGRVNARLVATHDRADLGLLELDPPLPLPADTPAVIFYPAEGLSIGAEVLFLGFPFPILFDPPLIMPTRGMVGNRYDIGAQTFYILDAILSEGMSGGPLFVPDGRLAGTVSSRFDPMQTRARRDHRPLTESMERTTNLTFAVPGHYALELLDEHSIPHRVRDQ